MKYHKFTNYFEDLNLKVTIIIAIWVIKYQEGDLVPFTKDLTNAKSNT